MLLFKPPLTFCASGKVMHNKNADVTSSSPFFVGTAIGFIPYSTFLIKNILCNLHNQVLRNELFYNPHYILFSATFAYILASIPRQSVELICYSIFPLPASYHFFLYLMSGHCTESQEAKTGYIKPNRELQLKTRSHRLRVRINCKPNLAEDN
uniref:Uncharacterized protein n=1 Tax=Micrurus surinamensis TaxID=129470 RepID=A0A2D4Q5U9_MICSU